MKKVSNPPEELRSGAVPGDNSSGIGSKTNAKQKEEVFGAQIRPVFLKIPPENIVWLKNILETYDGLGIIRTLDRFAGEIVILSLADTLDELMELLHSLESEIGFRFIPPPPSAGEDWLIQETDMLP